MNDITNVIQLDVTTTHDLPTNRVLAAAKAAELAHVIIVGATKDGYLYFASSIGEAAQIAWDLDQAKMALMRDST